MLTRRSLRMPSSRLSVFSVRSPSGLMQKRLPARSVAWIACVFSTCTAFALLGITGIALEISSLLPVVGIGFSCFCIHIIYTRFRPDPLISCLTGGVTAVLWAGVATGIAALAALRLNAPLTDNDLAYVDEALGMNVSVFVE